MIGVYSRYALLLRIDRTVFSGRGKVEEGELLLRIS